MNITIKNSFKVNRPFYSTIYKYKGLEHVVIILTDIESHAHKSMLPMNWYH